MNAMDVTTLAAKQSAGDDVFLLDVRQPNEAEICTIPGAVLIPMGDVPNRLGEIPRDRPVVVHCHHGGRSAKIVQYLELNGYNDVHNLSGGIEQWAVQIDPEMARY